MRERRILATCRIVVSPFRKIGLGRADGFFFLGEKESRRWEEVEFGRVEVGEVG